MATALELIAQKKAELAALEQAAEAEIAASKRTVMGEILDHMKENTITLAELNIYARVAGSKYSEPGTKNTWSGKGKKPGWVNRSLASGKVLEDLLTKPAQAVEQPLAAEKAVAAKVPVTLSKTEAVPA